MRSRSIPINANSVFETISTRLGGLNNLAEHADTYSEMGDIFIVLLFLVIGQLCRTLQALASLQERLASEFIELQRELRQARRQTRK